jgi:ABC-type proline/glycine betaine transport system ATPase subunit
MKEGRILQAATPEELRRDQADEYVRSLLTMTGEIEE